MSRWLFPLACFGSMMVAVACDDKDDDDDDDEGRGGSARWSDDQGNAGSAIDSGQACDEYIEVLVDCVESFGGELSDELRYGFCDGYRIPAYDARFNCYIDALVAADCSTAEGYAAAANEAAATCGS